MELQQTNVLTNYLLDTELGESDMYCVAIKSGEILLNNKAISREALTDEINAQIKKFDSKKIRAFAKKVAEIIEASEKEEMGEIFYLTYTIEYYVDNYETLTYQKGEEAIVKEMVDIGIIYKGGDGFFYVNDDYAKYMEV